MIPYFAAVDHKRAILGDGLIKADSLWLVLWDALSHMVL